MCWSTGFNDVEILVLCQWFLMLYVYIYIYLSIYLSIYLATWVWVIVGHTAGVPMVGDWLRLANILILVPLLLTSLNINICYCNIWLIYIDLFQYNIYTTQSHQSLTQSNAHRMSFGINPANHLQAPLAQGAHAPGPWCWAAGPRWPESSLMAS